jgi:hypothetical protein
MSSFFGLDFLKAYVESRENIKNEFSKKTTSTLTDTELITKLNLESYEDYDVAKSSEYESIHILRWVLFHSLKSINNLMTKQMTESFIKKFETKKKIYSKYSKQFKEISNEFTILQNYLFLSIICLIKYQQTLNLKFLNTALKLNDILCSQKNMIGDSNSELFMYSLEKEVSCVRQLCDRMKIALVK